MEYKMQLYLTLIKIGYSSIIVVIKDQLAYFLLLQIYVKFRQVEPGMYRIKVAYFLSVQ